MRTFLLLAGLSAALAASCPNPTALRGNVVADQPVPKSTGAVNVELYFESD